jgi:hypothetical protein
MKLAYRKYFPSDWDDEKIFQYVTSIVKDPKSSWKQITANGEWTFRPAKFFVDGVRGGMTIRVVLEPKANEILEARGILTAYPLEGS